MTDTLNIDSSPAVQYTPEAPHLSDPSTTAEINALERLGLVEAYLADGINTPARFALPLHTEQMREEEEAWRRLVAARLAGHPSGVVARSVRLERPESTEPESTYLGSFRIGAYLAAAEDPDDSGRKLYSAHYTIFRI